MILPDGDAAPILVAINNNDSAYKTNVSVIDNYFGDHTWFPFEVQLAGNERPMRGLNVTFDQNYFNANQVIMSPVASTGREATSGHPMAKVFATRLGISRAILSVRLVFLMAARCGLVDFSAGSGEGGRRH
jgi:hypothetical protein